MLENPGFDEKSSDKDRVGRKGGLQFLEWNIILLHIFTQTELVESKDENRALKLGNKWARNVSSKYVTLQGSGQSRYLSSYNGFVPESTTLQVKFDPSRGHPWSTTSPRGIGQEIVDSGRLFPSLSLSLTLEKKLIAGLDQRNVLINGEIIERKITTNSPRKRNGRSRYFRLQDSYLTYKGDESLSQNSPLPMISILPNFLQLPRAERAGRRLLSFLLLWEEEACTLLRYRWDPKSQDDFVSRSKGEYIRICRILLKQIRFKELKNKEREKIRSRIKLESDGMIY